MADDDLVTIARLDLAHEGHLVRMRLAAAGIEAFVIGDHTRQTFLLSGGGQIRVQVRESDHDAAIDALSSDDPYGDGLEIPLEDLEAEALAAENPVEDVEPEGQEVYDAPEPPPPIERYYPPSPTASHDEQRCPRCGAGNVRPRRLSSGRMFLSLLLLGLPLLLTHGQMECDICQHRWQ